MATTPPPATTPPRRPDWKPTKRMWILIAAAFAVGLVLFALAIRSSRDTGFFRSGEVPPSTAEPDYAPLPAPMAGDEGSGIGALEPPVIEPSATPERAAPPPPPPPTVSRREPTPEPRAPAVADRKPRPIPGQTPAPDYPLRALRGGEGGTVLVLAHIGPDGVPTATAIAQSSGSRELDRAAQQAVRRWRFEPAMSDGHPTVGQVVVPIDFRLSD